jgi:transcriptional regulator with XRE-family HTH domain
VNQKRLCEALDLSVQQMNDFENGSAGIDARQTDRLAAELNVPLSFFAEDTQRLKSIRGPRRIGA